MLLRSLTVILICCVQVIGSFSAVSDPIEDALVLILEPTSGQTHGTGFAVDHRNRVYVVTCRHVIQKAHPATAFAIPKPKKTKKLGVSNVLKLGAPVYHPDDSPSSTYDIAVLEILGATHQRLRQVGLSPLRMSQPWKGEAKDGLALTAAGYPTEYAERELSLSRDEPLPALRIDATLKRLPLDALMQSGFTAPLREAHFAETVGNSLGEGASGGPVYLKDRAGTTRVVGVLLGSASVKSSGFKGFVFGSSARIIETLR